MAAKSARMYGEMPEDIAKEHVTELVFQFVRGAMGEGSVMYWSSKSEVSERSS